MWSGWFYALNIYHSEVQEYLTGVFYRVFQQWGFDLVKLDFLYAACLAPPSHKTRGQMMADTMEFLRKQAGERWILGCGVPLGSAFGMVEYCRIGADIHLKWEHRFLAWLRNRERVSTIVALRTVLGRWPLNGRAFHNDPDVFLLRDQNIKLSPRQQYTILLLNTLLGNLLFTSDFVGEYSAEQWSEFQTIFQWRGSEIQTVTEIFPDVYRIDFKHQNTSWHALANLSGKTQEALLGKQLIPFARL